MNVAGNRYFALAESSASQLRNLINADYSRDHSLLAKLSREVGADEATILAQLRLSTQNAQATNVPILRSAPIARAEIAATVAAAFRTWRIERKVQRQPLKSLLVRISGRKKEGSSLRPRHAATLAAFAAARRIRSARGKCLPTSIALSDALACDAYYPDLVFGVTVEPFAAHCWLQHGDMVLNDHPDRVRTFTPILVV